MGRGKGSHNLSPFFYRKGKGRLRLLYLLCNEILMIVGCDYGTLCCEFSYVVSI